MDPTAVVTRAWARAHNPLDVFAAVTALAPRPLATNPALTQAVHATLPTPADRWVAARLLSGRLGVSTGLPAFGIPPAPIPIHFIRGSSAERVLVVAGVHGSEPQGMGIVRRLVRQMTHLRRRGKAPDVNVLVLPVLFPDNARVGPFGRRQGTIPTNRNFPAGGRPLSQAATTREGHPLDARGRPILPENQLLMRLLECFRPRHIVSVHGTKVPQRAGIFSDPYRVSPALRQRLRTRATASPPDARSVTPAALYGTLLAHAEADARRRTHADERLAVQAAEEVARFTDGLGTLRRARRRTEQRQAADAQRPAALAAVEAHPAVAGNRLGTSSTAHWSGEVANGVSLGSYAPARGIGVFTVEPAINRASATYPVPALDPGVSPTVRRTELRAYATAIRTVLLRTQGNEENPSPASAPLCSLDRESFGE